MTGNLIKEDFYAMSKQIYSEKGGAYFSNPRPDMLNFIPPGVQKVLEFGCGGGEFGAAIKERYGAEVVGIETHLDSANRAKQLLNRVLTADIEREQLDLPEGYFDCLVCNDVLEHLADPWAALGVLGRYVKKGGWLVVSIPNVRHHKVVRRLLWPGEWRYESNGVMDKTHLRFFTFKSACELVSGSGFHIESASGINRSSFPVWLRLVNWLCRGCFDDMRYLQFAIVARHNG